MDKTKVRTTSSDGRRELQILREAALISMSKKAQQQEAKELADLREAALDSARERKLSSDVQRKRRLETPPSHHLNNCASPLYESDDSGEHTPKMSECDSTQHTPPRDEPVQNTVFTVKVTESMVIKRTPKKCSRSSVSEHSEDSGTAHSPVQQDNNVKVLLTDNKRSPEREPEEEENAKVEEESHQAEREDELPIPQTVPTKEKSPAPVISTPKAILQTEVSPAVSKISSVDVPHARSSSQKQKKKHKKKKSSSKKKKPIKSQDSSSDNEKAAPKPSRNKRIKKHNGVSKHDKEPTIDSKERNTRNGDEKSHKFPRDLKKEIISELDSKIDKNIEMLQKAKKLKLENKNSKPVPKKIISEISSNEEQELLKPEKKKSLSPKNHRKDKPKESRDARPRSRSPSAVPDISVSLKSKREFEQMKAEMNKNVPKPAQRYETKKTTPRKSRRRSPSPSRKEHRFSPKRDIRPSSPKKNGKTSSPAKEPEKVPAKLVRETPKQLEAVHKSAAIKDDFHISEKEEMELLGDVTNIPGVEKPNKPDDSPAAQCPGDAINILREDDSLSDSDEGGDVVNITSDKKSLDAKKKKLKKSKKKKNKDDKKRKKKRKKRSMEDDSSSDSESPEKKKAKVKIDKSELNKIVQFLKQRDEQQKSVDGSFGSNRTAFNPKIISKDAKPIEIKLKSKPKR